MFRLKHRARWLVLAWAGAAGCARENGAGGPGNASGSNAASSETGAGAGGAASSSATDVSGGATLGPTEALITPRIRRLTNAEYDATVQALLGTEQTLGAQFVPDARLYKHAKFDRNEAQIVEPTLARQLQQAAEMLATEYAEGQLDQVLPCAAEVGAVQGAAIEGAAIEGAAVEGAAAEGAATCARSFFESFLPKAYRRSVPAAELDDLLALVVVPAIARDGFAAAVELGIEAALQSAAFLYHTELGADAIESGRVAMTNAEIGAALGYLLTGGPADAELTKTSDLALAASRQTQARRLLQTPGARSQVQRMVKQWLQIDQAGDVVRDKELYPDFTPQLFDSESNAFIDEVVFARGGNFEMLMGADFTLGSPQLAEIYAAPPPSAESGLIDLGSVPRRGILNRGAFLVSYPSPVKRGARVLTQVLCVDPGDPNVLNLTITLPPAEPGKTRRQRFEQHGQASCAGCHNMIDNLGFTFEHFNHLGGWEAAEADDPELPIDSVATLQLPAEIAFGTQTVADSSELATLASQSEAGSRCFARNLARFTAAAYGPALERGFLDEWERLVAADQDSVQEMLIAYVTSDLFIERDLEAQSGEP